MSNKLKSNKKKREDYEEQIVVSLIEYTLAIVGIVLCIMVPLYLKDGYHSVGEVKYQVYQWIMTVGFAVLFILTFVWLFVKKKFEKAELGDTDICVLAFLLLSFIAAIVGGNFKECVSGYSGWNMGLLALLSFGLIYFYFSRFGRYEKAVLMSLCATAMIVFVIGILHRLMIDPIGTYGLGSVEELADTYKNQFLSTIGQATWYSSFVCTVLPLGVGAFWCSKTGRMRVISGIFTFAGFCTMITQNSDSAYGALAGLLAVFLWFSAKSAQRMERFAEILLLFTAATRFMWLAFQIHPNSILSLDAFSHFCIYHPLMWLVFLVTILFWLAMYVCAKKGIYREKTACMIRNVIFICAGLVIAGAAAVLIMSAAGVLPEKLSSVTSKIPYLTWGDEWGNGRGRTWAFSLQMFLDMDIWHKIFGVGPDGYAPYAYSLYQDQLVQMWGERVLTNAHNEWMNALINYGLLGATAYIGIFVTAVRNFAKKQTEQPFMVGMIACIISYMCHNFFCYQQVCCTPFLFLIIGAGMYEMGREENLCKK